MEKDIIAKLHKNFESFSRAEAGIEFWYARDLQNLLGYNRWENFINIVDKAKIACQHSRKMVLDHFRDVTKMVNLGSDSKREVSDIKLTRYACYLIAQNGDPRKDEIAFAQTYFAMQTRKQEILEQRIAEFERVQAREKLSNTEKELSGIIFDRGVDGQGFGRIRSKGDKALFGGYSTLDMKEKLNVPKSRPIADFLPAVTIKAKDLASEITNHNLKKNKNISGEKLISKEHVKNNSNVRNTLTKSGIRPEALPAGEDTKRLEKKLKFETGELVG